MYSNTSPQFWNQSSPNAMDWMNPNASFDEPMGYFPSDSAVYQKSESWQPMNQYQIYDFHFGSNLSNDYMGQGPWQHVQQLQSNISRLELELSSLRSQMNEQRIRGELEVESDRLKQELSSIGRHSTEDQDDTASSPDTSKSASAPPKRRKYQRRPKPDSNAPIKPLTAYAQFAVDIRNRYSSQGLSFAEIAKRIGVDWQEMSDDVRDRYLTRSADEKQKYEKELRIYQETATYRDYHQYLANFKARSAEKFKADDS